MFGISGEHLLILAVVLLFFGPRRLPELGHTLGKSIRNFKESLAGIEEASYRKLEQQKENAPAPAPTAPPAGTNAEAKPAASTQA